MAVRARGYLLVAIQFALLGAIFIWDQPANWQSSKALLGAAALLQVAGIAVLGLGLIALGRSLTAHPQPLEKATLKTTGIYSLVRHPIYSGILMAATGQALSVRSFATAGLVAALLVLFMVKSRFEERLLMQKFADYRSYAQKVGRLLPLIGRLH
ncbi:MAG: hypothetical protein RL645_700 [Actinomycetota bacterium]|jgi:protein-S-isoprenylcysteine O-methyltransferase Ste14